MRNGPDAAVNGTLKTIASAALGDAFAEAGGFAESVMLTDGQQTANRRPGTRGAACPAMMFAISPIASRKSPLPNEMLRRAKALTVFTATGSDMTSVNVPGGVPERPTVARTSRSGLGAIVTTGSPAVTE